MKVTGQNRREFELITAALTPSNKHGNIGVVPEEETLAHEHLDQLEVEVEGLSSCPEEVGKQKVVQQGREESAATRAEFVLALC